MRNAWYDNIKGMLIILVVFGHLLTDVRGAYDDTLAEQAYLFLYTFHMPLFIMLSGYFYRANRHLRVVQLAVVYVVWQLILGSWATFVSGNEVLSTENVGLNLLQPYWALWYLMAIVIWYIVTPYVTQLRGYVIFAFLFALAFGFESDATSYFSLRKLIMFYPFFLIGNWMSERDTINFFSLPKRAEQRKYYRIGGMIVFGTLSLLLFGIFARQNQDAYYQIGNLFKFRFAYEKAIEGEVLGGPFTFLVVYVISILMSLGFALTVPGRPLPFITRAGQYSLYVYLVHIIIVLVWREFVPDDLIPSPIGMLVFLFVVAIGIVGLIISPPVVKLLRPLVDIELGEKVLNPRQRPNK